MVEAISATSLPLFNKVAGGSCALMAMGCLAYAWELNRRFYEELALEEAARRCERRLSNLSILQTYNTPSATPNTPSVFKQVYLLANNHEQKELEKLLAKEVEQLLRPFEKDRRISKIMGLLRNIKSFLDSKWKIVGSEGISLQEVALAAIAYKEALVADPLAKDKLTSEGKKWVESYPSEAVEELHRISKDESYSYKDVNEDETIKSHLKALLEWLILYPDTPYSLNGLALEKIDALDAFQNTKNLSQVHFWIKAHRLHQLWQALIYPQPLILKSSSLLDPLIWALSPRDFEPQTSRAPQKYLFLGAFLLSLGAVAIFFRGNALQTVSPLFIKRVASAALTFIAIGSLAKAIHISRLFQEGLARHQAVQKLCNLHAQRDAEGRSTSCYCLKNTIEQATLKQILEEVAERLERMDDAAVRAMASRAKESSSFFNGQQKIIASHKNGVSLFKVVEAGINYRNACLNHPKIDSLPSKEKEWLELYPKEAGEVLDKKNRTPGITSCAPDEETRKAFEELIEWMNKYPKVYDFEKDVSQTPDLPYVDAMASLDLSFGRIENSKKEEYDQSVRTSHERLHNIWKALAYPNPIVLKGSFLLDSLIKELATVDFTPKRSPMTSTPWLLGAFASAIGAVALFLKS